MSEGKTIDLSAMKSGMDRKTVRKYLYLGKLPSECKVEHTWRTREDPFSEVWDEIRGMLEFNPGLQSDTIFKYLQRREPGRYQDGQLRTLQRRLKIWRALEGDSKEVFFPQEHHPGILCASDFCNLSDLSITINGVHFQHLLYHFVLTYSNWETGNICFAESFESLSFGLQQALWELGGVPVQHRTDSLSAAVKNLDNRKDSTERYHGLLKYYGLQPQHTQAGNANENGDIEQRHYRFRVALEQALMLRGSREFSNRDEYERFLKHLFSQLNAGRQLRLKEEQAKLKSLPDARLESCKRFRVRVGPSSTIRVNHNVYSVNSRLIKEWVDVKMFAEHLEVWYAQRIVESLPRVRGQERYEINYRHIIDWLIRKPGAFANYRYRESLFPTSRFRMAYDELTLSIPASADKEYLKILQMAAIETEQGVDDALRFLMNNDKPVNADMVKELIQSGRIPPATEIRIQPVNLKCYDNLLEELEVTYA
ncbi:MAG: IS21 family transposase [SAR324 cluster bacterium]|uniref:IS21 family transposase n=1 Tax=SAR324 cluster bacterium TaxID=2024889 RepID=A0A7X9FS59_9DELT|nr:IS21 family transposase [SAR324 cluster bacterium]